MQSLTLIGEDFRSENKLEICVFTKNEEERILNILIKYSEKFNVVLLDDASLDRTIKYARQYKATVFQRRNNCFFILEYYLQDYVNEMSASGKVFWMLADEYMEPESLECIEKILQNNNCQKRKSHY